MMLRGPILGGCLMLAACAGHAPREHGQVAPPAFELRLSPASLGHELALQQQLNFQYGQEQRTFDALLEADRSEVRLEIQAMGQSAMRLRWDGQKLDQQRAQWLPKSVRGEEILSDLQLANWPVAAIRAALPAGWSLVEVGTTRKLCNGAVTVVTVSYPAADRIDIEHANFRLNISSVPVQ
jgi:Protein of unknown function (DUF3261)